tara:strand:- start:1352 stop:2077 length:726 start_codon:yes stop_codon:yes gene_type:complete
MKTLFTSKQEAREAIWDCLKENRLAAFPFPPHGRIPNFVGAKEAALRVFDEPEWRDAKIIKVNPDSPQKYVRAEALRRNIIVYVPTPRLQNGFLRLDPKFIPADAITDASHMARCDLWAQPVPLKELPQVDAIVTGSVTVTKSGKRAGKGAGYSDIEFAILRELGHSPVPVATTVNDVQIVESFPIESNDLTLAVIATPTQTIRVPNPLQTPSQIEWEKLTIQNLEDMPILAELKALKQVK